MNSVYFEHLLILTDRKHLEYFSNIELPLNSWAAAAKISGSFLYNLRAASDNFFHFSSPNTCFCKGQNVPHLNVRVIDGKRRTHPNAWKNSYKVAENFPPKSMNAQKPSV